MTAKIITIDDPIFYNGSTTEETEALQYMFPNKIIEILMIVPRRAHIVVYEEVM